MYVAAPITDNGKVIGVVSVSKPNSSIQPYIDRTQSRLGLLAMGVVIIGLILCINGFRGASRHIETKPRSQRRAGATGGCIAVDATATGW